MEFLFHFLLKDIAGGFVKWSTLINRKMFESEEAMIFSTFACELPLYKNKPLLTI